MSLSIIPSRSIPFATNGKISSLLGGWQSILLEKATATHSSTLAWKIARTEEPGRMRSMGSLRVGLSNLTFTFYFHALEKEMATHSSVLAWRIPGTGSLGGCRLWGRTESDTTEETQQQQQQQSILHMCIYIYILKTSLFIHLLMGTQIVSTS